MSELALVLIIMVVFISILVFYVLSKKLRSQKEKQAYGVIWLHHLRHLLADIQQHRGLSSGYLNGDVNLMPRIEDLQKKIGQDIKQVNSINQWIICNNNWLAISSHWSRLKDQYTSNTIANNLQQHGKLIRNLLYLVEEMAEEHHLLHLESVSGVDIDFIWKDLLETTEYMGQARALGTGIAASGNCGSVEKVKLHYLKDKIKSSGASLAQQLPNANKASKSIGLLLTTIDKNFIHGLPDSHFISAEEYFNIATTALNGIYEEYDKLIEMTKGVVWEDGRSEYVHPQFSFTVKN